MPSLDIHLKYGVMFGIKKHVQEVIDKYIDDSREEENKL